MDHRVPVSFFSIILYRAENSNPLFSTLPKFSEKLLNPVEGANVRLVKEFSVISLYRSKRKSSFCLNKIASIPTFNFLTFCQLRS
ncbi:hypothetical protein D3C73_712530 [compost metagenome]